MEFTFQYDYAKFKYGYVRFFWYNIFKKGVLGKWAIMTIAVLIIHVSVIFFFVDTKFKDYSLMVLVGVSCGFIGILFLDILKFWKEMKNVSIWKTELLKNEPNYLKIDSLGFTFSINERHWKCSWKNYKGAMLLKNQLFLIPSDRTSPIFRISKKELDDNFGILLQNVNKHLPMLK